MSPIKRISITLPAEMAAGLRRTVEGGRYASASEIIREALSEWQGRRDDETYDLESFREVAKVGHESGSGVPGDEVFTDQHRVIATRYATPSGSVLARVRVALAGTVRVAPGASLTSPIDEIWDSQQW